MSSSATEPIGLHLTRTAKVVGRAFDDALANAGGSLPIWLILMSLKSKRHSAQRELAEAVGIEGPTLTHHLNRMETAGLVTRTRDRENRRIHHVELTNAGEDMFRQLLGTVVAFDQQLRVGFADSEVAVLDDLFARLRSNITNRASLKQPSEKSRSRATRHR